MHLCVSLTEFFISFMLVPPPAPTGLTVEVNGSSVELNWNAASDDEEIDFYQVTVYLIEGGSPIMLHRSLEKDTHEHVIFYHITGTLIANLSSSNRCGQMSRNNASMSFVIKGKYISKYYACRNNWNEPE